MAFDANYPCDTEFSKLLARRSDVDLTVAALELARDAYPQLEFRETLLWIDELSDGLSAAIASAGTDRAALMLLSNGIARDCGITGDSESYGDPDNSYLHRVIQRKRGIPISLSVLYMAVAERIGLALQGVSAPAHFLTRLETAAGSIFLDPFCDGQLISYEEALSRVRCATGMSSLQSEPFLEPVGPREVIIRMLTNLKANYARLNNWHAAWVVQHRLALLNPVSYEEKRDLGFIALKADRPGEAIDLLEGCLKSCPQEDREPLTLHLQEAQRQLGRWN